MEGRVFAQLNMEGAGPRPPLRKKYGLLIEASDHLGRRCPIRWREAVEKRRSNELGFYGIGKSRYWEGNRE